MNYDVFLSHSHKDKAWTHALYERLSTIDYHGRKLRTWLGARVLDPGNLSSARELESALDRSRRLAIVLTPESRASDWVQHEIRYFLGLRRAGDVAVIRHRPCAVPEPLAGARFIDWPEGAGAAEPFAELIGFLRPGADDQAEYDHRRAVRKSFGAARVQLPRGFDPTPTGANGALLDLLLSVDISDLDQEGLALAGFDRIGQLVAEMDADESYAMKMVLGEFLAVAALRHPAYARVAAAYVDKDFRSEDRPSFLTLRNRALRGKAEPPSITNLLFAVARSGAKLAEIDPALVDLSTLAAVLGRLDRHPDVGAQEKTVAAMAGRLLGKLRNTGPGNALLHALANWGGDASHLAAAAAISTAYGDRDDPAVFYTEELRRLAEDAKTPPVGPPLPRTARLLLDPASGLGSNPRVAEDIRRSREDYARAFGAGPPGGSWPDLETAPSPARLENGPLAGTVRRVTLANMEEIAGRLGPTDIACLTEPRIVDALFDGVAGFVVDEREAEAPLGVRLRSRGARFATYGRRSLDRFPDGGVLVLWPSPEGSPARGLAVGTG